MAVTDKQRATYDRLQGAAAVGAQTRLDRLAGKIDEYDVRERHLSDFRKAVGFARLHAALRRSGRADVSEWAAVQADLRDDGSPDWVFFLDNPGRRYRLRPWRQEDGEPWSHRTPCISVADSLTCRVMRGIPAGVFPILGLSDILHDTDECCLRLFDVSARRVRKR